MNSRNRGFTLLEIMITVAVLAVVGTALVRSATQTVTQTTTLQERTLGLWIAENEINRLRMAPRTDENFPSIGTRRYNLTMADRDWEVVVQVESTENKDMRRLQVGVYDETRPDTSVAELTAFLGRY
ncbi:MAG: type II secretion system minor pseudopilin GspI [Pseudomonadales bacterium]|nr:type II secretion system minor pseudopilin GspI [Pseudomonadales bacterium]